MAEGFSFFPGVGLGVCAAVHAALNHEKALGILSLGKGKWKWKCDILGSVFLRECFEL